MKIQLKILNKPFYCNEFGEPKSLELPKYATSGSAAIDLICTMDVTIYPGETKMIHTGLAIWIGSHPTEIHFGNDFSVAGFIIPKSGRGADEGLVLANTVGLIDEDYQGELKVSAWNRNKSKFKFGISTQEQEYYAKSYGMLDNTIQIKAGERFCQIYFSPVIKAEFEVVEKFPNETQRGEGGWGSTGK